MRFQVFAGLVVPLCASYVVEARHRAIFVHQLRDQLRATGSTGAPGPSSSAPAFAAVQTLNSQNNESHRTDSARQLDRCVEELDEQPAPMLADLIVIVAWLPVVSVLMWHVICRILLWWRFRG